MLREDEVLQLFDRLRSLRVLRGYEVMRPFVVSEIMRTGYRMVRGGAGSPSGSPSGRPSSIVFAEVYPPF